MAEASGFFQAVWDESLIDPTTGEATGYWDRNYIAQQFADYFALFIGNGVFGSPTNQCKVISGTGLTVVVTPGWAFINGLWYHNDANLVLSVPENTGSVTRQDSVRLRWSDSDRAIQAVYVSGSTTNTRTSSIYDLKLANVSVPVNAATISNSNITDTRTNESVCGLVKGLMEIETTADLFAQYQAQFNEWFDEVKDQLTGDLAIRLQLEFDELNDNVDTYYNNTQSAISGYESNISQQISGYNSNYQATLNQTRQAASTAESLVEDYVDNDYVIPLQTFTFTNRVCTILDEKIKASSLVDVYFTAASIPYAEDAVIVVDTSAGTITMTANKQPEGTIQGYIRVRVN